MWVLLICIYTGNNQAVTSIPGFASEEHCQAAGAKSSRLAYKATYACVKQSGVVDS